MIKTENFIFGTSTSRSGSSLVANLLSANKNIIITKDLIHFLDLFITDITQLLTQKPIETC